MDSKILTKWTDVMRRSLRRQLVRKIFWIQTPFSHFKTLRMFVVLPFSKYHEFFYRFSMQIDGSKFQFCTLLNYRNFIVGKSCVSKGRRLSKFQSRGRIKRNFALYRNFRNITVRSGRRLHILRSQVIDISESWTN